MHAPALPQFKRSRSAFLLVWSKHWMNIRSMLNDGDVMTSWYISTCDAVGIRFWSFSKSTLCVLSKLLCFHQRFPWCRSHCRRGRAASALVGIASGSVGGNGDGRVPISFPTSQIRRPFSGKWWSHQILTGFTEPPHTYCGQPKAHLYNKHAV